MTTAYERLEQLLDDKDGEIAKLTARVEELEEEAERDWEWARHQEYKVDPSPSLPVPRLEIRWFMGDREQTAVYSFVYKHLCDQIVFVPLGKTRRSGPDTPPRTIAGEIGTPFRDGAHIRHDMDATKLPGFAILGSETQPLEGRRVYLARMREERRAEDAKAKARGSS